MQRPLDGRAGGDTDHRAVAHQRGVERDRDVARRRELAERSGQAGIVAGERGRQRTDAQACLQLGDIRQFGHERAVDEHQTAALHIAEQSARRSSRRASPPHPAGRPAAWLRASARADRCISSPRRGGAAGLPWRTGRTRRRAAPRSAPSRGSRARLRKASASAVSAAVLISLTSAMIFIRDIHSRLRCGGTISLTPRPPDTRHSRGLRVRAPDPCRRS